MKHTEARSVIVEAFQRVLGRAPTRPEAQVAQCIAHIETQYGQGWKGVGQGSNNWGAIQKGSWKGATFAYTDTRPNDDGTSTPYVTEFRKYPGAVDGAADVVRVAFTGRRATVLEAATRGDLGLVSERLYDTVYYQGFGRTRDERVENHHRAMLRAAILMARKLGEPLPDGSKAPPSIRRGDGGEWVALWLSALSVEPGAQFDIAVDFATRAFQRKHGLVVDGIVGPATWSLVISQGLVELPREVTEPRVDLHAKLARAREHLDAVSQLITELQEAIDSDAA